MDDPKLKVLLEAIMAVLSAQNKHIAMLLESNRLTVQRLAVMEKSLTALEDEAARVRKEMTDHFIPHYIANDHIADNTDDIEKLLWLLPKDHHALLKPSDDELPPIHLRFDT